MHIEAANRSDKEKHHLAVMMQQAEHPMQGLPVKDVRSFFFFYPTLKSVFTGKDAIDWMVQYGWAYDRKEAVELGNQLIDEEFVSVEKGTEGLFEDNPRRYYKLVKEEDDRKDGYDKQRQRKSKHARTIQPRGTLAAKKKNSRQQEQGKDDGNDKGRKPSSTRKQSKKKKKPRSMSTSVVGTQQTTLPNCVYHGNLLPVTQIFKELLQERKAYVFDPGEHCMYLYVNSHNPKRSTANLTRNVTKHCVLVTSKCFLKFEAGKISQQFELSDVISSMYLGFSRSGLAKVQVKTRDETHMIHFVSGKAAVWFSKLLCDFSLAPARRLFQGKMAAARRGTCADIGGDKS